ncbi:recombinase zinc ribbon domain-containing protein [Bradyrhizobium sp. 25ACV]
MNSKTQEPKHEGIVTLETFEKIQHRIDGVARAPMRADIRSDFPLRGSVCCAECGKPLSACWSTSSTGVKHPYYLRIARGCGRYRKSIRRDAVETRFSELLKQLMPSTKLIDLACAMFKEAWRQRVTQSAQMVESYTQQKAKIEKETRRLIDLIIGANSNELAKAYERRLTSWSARSC